MIKKCPNCGYVVKENEVHCCGKDDQIFITTNRNLFQQQPMQKLNIDDNNVGNIWIGET